MPTLTVVIPSSLDGAVQEAAGQRGQSVDSIVSLALAEYLNAQDHRMYQISTSGALVEGVDKGAVCSRTLLEHGDFGLGTFENLDGEMVIVDGAIYQCLRGGRVAHREDDFQIPFAVVTRFREDEAFEPPAVRCLRDLELACDPHRESRNLFYALRVDGSFETIRARAVSGIAAGMRLAEAAKDQSEFHFSDVEGTLVGLWSPGFSSSFNVPGYHFHFISKDRTKGGHVLDCSAGKLQVKLQMLFEYDVRLPDSGSFLTADLSKDPAATLAKVE
jgi:acetolactate decarboxylase